MFTIYKYYCNGYKSNRIYRAKTIIFLLTAVLIADGCGAQTTEEPEYYEEHEELEELEEIEEHEKHCDPHQLSKCVHTSLRSQLELPRNKEELDKQCLTYHTDAECMDEWAKRCLAKHLPDKQKLVQDRIGGARALVQYLCSNDTALRSDFLKEVSCWSLVSPDWSRCVDKLQLASRHISRRRDLDDFNKTSEICCAQDWFISCVGHAGRACSTAAGAQLQRMSWVLAEDVVTCSPEEEDQPRAPCATAQGGRLAALLPLQYYVYNFICYCIHYFKLHF